MLPTNELYNLAWGHSRRIMENSKDQLQPLVYLHIKGGIILAMPFKARDEDPGYMEDFMKDVIIHMVRTGIHMDLVEGVVMPSEAWMASVPMTNKPSIDDKFPRASKAPNRIECLVLAVWGAEGRRIGFYEIKDRMIGKEIERISPTATMEELKAHMETWLDKGFDKVALPTPRDAACAALLQVMIAMSNGTGKPEHDMSKFFFGALERIIKSRMN